MKNSIKLYTAILLCLCLMLPIFAVSCADNEEATTDSTGTTEAVPTETSGSADNGTSSEKPSDTEGESTSDTEPTVNNVGHGSELSDDGFIKIGWEDYEK